LTPRVCSHEEVFPVGGGIFLLGVAPFLLMDARDRFGFGMVVGRGLVPDYPWRKSISPARVTGPAGPVHFPVRCRGGPSRTDGPVVGLKKLQRGPLELSFESHCWVDGCRLCKRPFSAFVGGMRLTPP